MRGEHNPAGSLVLNGVLAGKPEFVALRQATAELLRDIRGRGDAAILDWDTALATESAMSDKNLVDDTISDPDLRSYLHKGLYELGVAAPANNVG